MIALTIGEHRTHHSRTACRLLQGIGDPADIEREDHPFWSWRANNAAIKAAGYPVTRAGYAVTNG